MASPTIEVLLTTSSDLKITTTKDVFQEMFPNRRFSFLSFPVASSALPAQPYLSTSACTSLRIELLTASQKLKPNQIVVAIENGIEGIPYGCLQDVCFCQVLITGPAEARWRSIHGHSVGIPIERKYFLAARAKNQPGDHDELGFSVTVGEMIAEDYPDIDPKNWMADPRLANTDRRIQIAAALRNCLHGEELFPHHRMM